LDNRTRPFCFQKAAREGKRAGPIGMRARARGEIAGDLFVRAVYIHGAAREEE